jgi:CspA family cold shock protein
MQIVEKNSTFALQHDRQVSHEMGGDDDHVGNEAVTTELEGARRVNGLVKWFDPVTGFGFVVADEGGPDILLHANVLRNFGQSSVADGAIIELNVQRTERGIQATEVFHIEPPVTAEGATLADFEDIDPEVIRAAALEPARVKWFDKGKGFGFANIFGRGEDVFVHVEVLRRSGLADLQPGEAVGLRVIDGKRGRMATEVCAWEAALKSDEV